MEGLRILIALTTTSAITNGKTGSERAAIGLATELAARGHEINIVNLLCRGIDWEEGYDILHCINAGGTKGPYINAIRTAHLLGIPAVTSTIFWPVELQFNEMDTLYGWTQQQHDESRAAFNDYYKQCAMFFAESDMLLPNAVGEYEEVMKCIAKFPALRTRINPEQIPWRVISNAVDYEGEVAPVIRSEGLLPKELESKLKERFVLCVGRIEARKNQHRLVDAMSLIWQDDPDLQLVLVGRGQPEMISALGQRWAGLNVLVHGEAANERVLQLMKRCVVYAQPSLLETPGLALMEAASIGVPIVSGNQATEKEYFGEHAYYANPLDSSSIATALRSALAEQDSAKTQARIEHILNNYTYPMAVDALEEAYQLAMKEVN